ncbi:MAG: acylphosphatase [Lachnospiraceae bacterium]|nr:acylphosphatase [Lachnospiraceae bacterium]
MAEKIREHLVFYGQVQGVGFRYRARHVASGLGITGWVRNEWDGTVEMEAQGTKEQINHMLLLINQGTYIQVEDIDRRELPVEEAERGFHIR